jgi:hypothetical protein
MKKILLTFVTLVLGTHVLAASDLEKACKIELRKFHCKKTTDAEIHECLAKNEKEKKYEGFSKKCSNAYETYELKMEKHEEKEEGKESEKKD